MAGLAPQLIDFGGWESPEKGKPDSCASFLVNNPDNSFLTYEKPEDAHVFVKAYRLFAYLQKIKVFLDAKKGVSGIEAEALDGCPYTLYIEPLLYAQS